MSAWRPSAACVDALHQAIERAVDRTLLADGLDREFIRTIRVHLDCPAIATAATTARVEVVIDIPPPDDATAQRFALLELE